MTIRLRHHIADWQQKGPKLRYFAAEQKTHACHQSDQATKPEQVKSGHKTGLYSFTNRLNKRCVLPDSNCVPPVQTLLIRKQVASASRGNAPKTNQHFVASRLARGRDKSANRQSADKLSAGPVSLNEQR